MAPRGFEQALQNNSDTPTAQALLDRTACFYHGSLPEDEKAYSFLRQACLADEHLLETFCIGCCTGQLAAILPAKENAPQVYAELTCHGILCPTGNESLIDCITLPLRDPDGGTVGIAGLNPAVNTEIIVGQEAPHIWNLPAAAVHADLIAATSLPDGLALSVAGIPNVIAFVGQPRPEDATMLSDLGVSSLTIIATPEVATSYRKQLSRITCSALPLPANLAPAAFLRIKGKDQLAAAIDNATPIPLDPAISESATLLSDGFQCSFANRRYELRGIEQSSRRLKAAVRAERQNRLHVDTVDFYSARARRNLSLDLCRFFEDAKEVIDADVDRLIRLCERWLEERPDPDTTPSVQLTDKEVADARAFGAGDDLLDQLQCDYETCGLVGETANKLLCYLAAVSRKMPDPISILILSSSGAGKSALQDATLKLCPPEDVVRLTSMTGKALFYKGRKSLKHKILALEEEAGAEGASYPLRALISSGELIIETTTKDLGSGKLTTVQNRVEGPTSVFITTTSPNTDPETRSRFFVTSVDESRAQTRRILDFQRKSRTLKGQSSGMTERAVMKRHRNFQRLLQPLVIVNPFAEELAYGDDRLKSRRDQPKLLNLIASVAFLRQMSKPIKTLKDHGQQHAYIEVDSDDLKIAQELAGQVLRHSLDDLNPVSFELLGEIRKLVNARIEAAREEGAAAPDPKEITFTRRELREFSGWPHIRVRRYLVELVEMEFITVIAGRMGRAYRYALCAECAQPGQTWSEPGLSVTPCQIDSNGNLDTKS
ncbi:MAG: hypothetical protein HN919_12685 [Verrucomicrobia bacterium]|jgi:DNA primase|nr:hypothetical protein [Verrucomicrobiota bacterium]